LTFVWVTHAPEVARQATRLIEMRDGLIGYDSAFVAGQPSGVPKTTGDGGTR
jgi:ABC-type lipoprotein export system ATPase subunit